MNHILRAILTPKAPDSPRLDFTTTLAAWWQACRPPFFITAAVPVTVGLAFALRVTGEVDWTRFLLILLSCCLGLTIANFANDLFDYAQGVDDGDNIGGSRVIQTGLISPRQLTLAMLGLIVAILGLGGWLVQSSGQAWLWGAVIFSLLSAIFYVAPPINYGRKGLGELLVGLNMGFIMVAGTVSVLTGLFFPASLALSLPVCFMVAGILYYQSLPEIETDPAAGKNTLASRLGKEKAAFLFRLWWPAVWILIVNLLFCGLVGWPALLGLLSFPLYSRACRHIRAAQASNEWLSLDAHGHLVRKLYLFNGLTLILGLLF